MALLVVLGFLAVLMIGSSAMFAYLNRTMSRSMAIENRQVCLNLAEAGMQKALAEFGAGRSHYAGEEGTALGDGTFSVAIAPGEASGKYRVTATGARNTAKATVIADIRVAGGEVRVERWQEVRGW